MTLELLRARCPNWVYRDVTPNKFNAYLPIRTISDRKVKITVWRDAVYVQGEPAFFLSAVGPDHLPNLMDSLEKEERK